MLSQGLKTAWVPWIVHWTGSSAQTARRPEFRNMPLVATGEDPEECIDTEPELPSALTAQFVVSRTLSAAEEDEECNR